LHTPAPALAISEELGEAPYAARARKLLAGISS